MKNPIFPAIAFLLLAWALIAILTATIITGVKLVVKLWAYLNPPKLAPSTAAVYAPIFETMPPAETSPSGFQIALGSLPTEFVTVPISNRRCPKAITKSPLAEVGKKSARKPKATISALIREEFEAV
jgi:hypothetical protein